MQWQTANLVENQFAPIWKQMVAEFEAANPGIKIEPILVARKDHWTRFVTAAQARRAPCVVEADIDRRPPITATCCRSTSTGTPRPPRSARPGRRTCSPARATRASSMACRSGAACTARSTTGRWWSPPGSIPAKPPQTWDDYLTWMKKLTKPGQWGTAITAGNTDTTTRSLLSWIWSNGGEAFNANMTEATFAKNPKSLQAIKFFIDLVAPGRRRAGADHDELSRTEHAVRAGQDRLDAHGLLGDRQGRAATTRR